MYKAKERLYLTSDRQRVVKESDPDSAFLLVTEGGTISEGDAKKYGLTQDQDKPEPEPNQEQSDLETPSPEALDTDDKAVDGPQSDKAIRGSRNK